MKKIIAILSMVTALSLFAGPAATNSAPAKAEVSSQEADLFWPTESERANGIMYLDEGVYRFSVTDSEGFKVVRAFGPMLVSFRKAHPALQLESAVVTAHRSMDAHGIMYQNTEFVVTFRLK